MFMNIRQNIQNVASGRTDSILPHMLNMPELTIVPYGCVKNARENQKEPTLAQLWKRT